MSAVSRVMYSTERRAEQLLPPFVMALGIFLIFVSPHRYKAVNQLLELCGKKGGTEVIAQLIQGSVTKEKQ